MEGHALSCPKILDADSGGRSPALNERLFFPYHFARILVLA